MARSYNGSKDERNELIEFAWNINHRHTAPVVRFKLLLGSAFSTKLYELICRLGHTRRTFHTMIRAATTVEAFRTVKIILGPPPAPPHKAATISIGLNSVRKQSMAVQQNRTTVPSSRPRMGTEDIVDTIRPYLSKDDQCLGLIRLQPMAKQDTAILVGSVIRGHLLPPGSNAYYQFGFVTCNNKDAERILCDLYEKLLRTNPNQNAIFNKILNSLESNTLTTLFHYKPLQTLQESIPTLHNFLTTPPQHRPSTYRLIQFLRDTNNEEPPPCLKRDFGFHLCTQRAHVQTLKNLYIEILSKTTPMELHHACENRGLLRFAIKTLGCVDVGMYRFLRNDAAESGVGFDGLEGLGRFVQPLFKRSF
jgi:hypothetical protein